MADKRDYYEILGVSKDATESQIKNAYRKLAKKYHPDANSDDPQAEAKFKEASEAYAVLSDAEKRKQYDRYGHSAFDGAQGGGGFDFSNMGDIFSDIFGSGGFGGAAESFFGDMFGGSRRRSRSGGAGPQRGADVRVHTNITMDEAFTGVTKKVNVNLKEECASCKGTGAKKGTSPETCSKCGGSGQVVFTQQSFLGMMRSVGVCPDCNGSGKIIKEKCPDCHGSGFKSAVRKIEIAIPPGIDHGQFVRLSGQGDPGINGGERGDLLVGVSVSNNTEFERDGYDLFSEVYVDYPTAVLGGDVRVKTIDGEVIYTVKPGTVSGTRVRLRGKGMPTIRNKNTRGDLYITLIIEVPSKLTEEQTKALEAYRATLTGKEKIKGKSKKKGIFK